VVHGSLGGRPPALDLAAEQRLHRLLDAARPFLHSAHDCSEGGVAVALAESAFGGPTGFGVELGGSLQPHAALFAETPSRAVVTCEEGDVDPLLALARNQDVPAQRIGATGGTMLDFGVCSISLDRARSLFESSLPTHLSGSI